MELSDKRHIVRGRLTRCDLTRTDDFFAPWQADPWGTERPQYRPALARMSAELSANIYDLDVGRWLSAGWRDCSLQVENRVFGGIGDWYHGGIRPGRALHNGITLLRARTMIHPLRNPIGDVLRAMRQTHTTDTGKAVVMARKDPKSGRFIISICFMGTSRKFYDWLTNFKLSSEQGLHVGFLQLARQFDGNTERIVFPELSEELDEASLTLEDILAEARRQDSRFLVWVTGHSQGGAVCQTYMQLLLHERGVLPQNLVGYSFAAPTVAGPDWQGVPSNYPLFNLINADDYVVRVGASMRLGVDLTYYPDDAFRAQHYGYSFEDPQRVFARDRVQRIMIHIRDTEGALEAMLSLCTALQEMKDPLVMLEILSALHIMLRYLKPAMGTIGIQVENVNRLLMRQLTVAYRAATGRSPDPDSIHARSLAIREVIVELGAQPFIASFLELLFVPHGIAREYDRNGTLRAPYCAIACVPAAQLQWAIWHTQEDCQPQRMIREEETIMPPQWPLLEE